MLPLEKLQNIKKIVPQYKDIKCVYLFGSFAEGRERKSSDIDIGVLCNENYKSDIKLDLLSDFVKAGYCNVDLTIINQADLLTAYEIVKNNKIIYKRNDFDTAQYYSITVRKYLDFKPFLAVQREYLKERILGG